MAARPRDEEETYMETDRELYLVGSSSSPYTRKLRAALRYRRIPYRFVVIGSKEAKVLPERPLPLVPYLVVTGDDGAPHKAMSDTTPILNHLETAYSHRSLRPIDPALGLIDLLLEDYGDEWLSKCMFHYRWGLCARHEEGEFVSALWTKRPDDARTGR
jgi:glutathione S-transferase